MVMMRRDCKLLACQRRILKKQFLDRNASFPSSSSFVLALFLVAFLPTTSFAFSATPIITGIGALLFPVRNSEITLLSDSASRRTEIDQASDFFLQSFWTGKVGGGAKQLTPAQERQLKTSQTAEFQKRYGGSNKRQSELLLLKDDNAAIIGCVGIQMDRVGDMRAPLMSNLAIDASYRRRGLAERLVRAAEECVVSQLGVPECYLYVESRNKGAVKLYKKLGYQEQWTDDMAQTLLPTADGRLQSQVTVIICMKKDLNRRSRGGWWQ